MKYLSLDLIRVLFSISLVTSFSEFIIVSKIILLFTKSANFSSSIAPILMKADLNDLKKLTLELMQTKNLSDFKKNNEKLIQKVYDERTKDVENKLLIKSNDKYFTTLANYKERNKITDSKKIIYCSDSIAQSSALNICLSDNKEVIKSDPLIDAQFLPWLESKNEDYQFQRVDSEINELEDKESNEIVDKDGKSNSENLRDTIVKALNNEKVTVKVQSLSSNGAPPAMILLPEQMRRINDMGAYMEQRMPGLPEYHVLLINKEHPLIVGLNKITGNKIIIDEKDPIENPLASKIANHVYDMAKLSVGGLDQEQILSLIHI